MTTLIEMAEKKPKAKPLLMFPRRTPDRMGSSEPAGALLSHDPLAEGERPPLRQPRGNKKLPYYEVSLQRFHDSDIVQWYVRSVVNTVWYSYGPRMQITAAGKRALEAQRHD